MAVPNGVSAKLAFGQPIKLLATNNIESMCFVMGSLNTHDKADWPLMNDQSAMPRLAKQEKARLKRETIVVTFNI